MGWRWRPGVRLGLTWIVAVTTLCSCARTVPPETTSREDPLDRMYFGRFASVDSAARSIEVLHRSAYRAKWWFEDVLAKPRPLPHFPRLDPILDARLRTLPDSTHVRVMVTFGDTVTMPPFPRLRGDLPRNAPQNVALLDTAAAVIQEIEKRRSARYGVDTVALKTNFQARILDHFWVAQSCWVELRADSVRSLQSLPQVEFIGPDTGRVAPHHDNNRANDTDAARARINSDPYFGLLAPDGRMALLDTGVRTEHLLLCNPSHLCMVADCVSPKPNRVDR